MYREILRYRNEAIRRIMSEPKVIWSGTYAGIEADVRVVGGTPVPFLAGRMATWERDIGSILEAAAMGLALERDILLERLTRVEGPAKQLVDIDNNLAEGRDVAAKASFHDSVMRPIEELRVYLGNVKRAEKRGQTIFDWEVDRRKRVERERDELRERLARIEKLAKNVIDMHREICAGLPPGEFVKEKYDARDWAIDDLRNALGLARFRMGLDAGRSSVFVENEALRERLAKLEAGLATACNEWEYASQYKGEFLAEKHGDAEDIAELRELLKGTGDVET